MSEALYYFFLGIALFYGIPFIGLFIINIIQNLRIQNDEWEIIEKFCKEKDYCIFGCKNAGYNCPSDHK